MTQDQGDEFRLENEEEEKDVEAHGPMAPPFEPPFEASRSEDEVEAHGPMAPPFEPPFEASRSDDEGDEVEGHAAFGPFAPDKPAL